MKLPVWPIWIYAMDPQKNPGKETGAVRLLPRLGYTNLGSRSKTILKSWNVLIIYLFSYVSLHSFFSSFHCGILDPWPCCSLCWLWTHKKVLKLRWLLHELCGLIFFIRNLNLLVICFKMFFAEPSYFTRKWYQLGFKLRSWGSNIHSFDIFL